MALGLDVATVVKRVRALHRLDDGIEEFGVESGGITGRTWTADEVVIGSIVAEVADCVLVGLVGDLEAEGLRHDHPADGVDAIHRNTRLQH